MTTTLQNVFTESSKGFERKPFRVLLIIQNNLSFKNSHESLLSEHEGRIHCEIFLSEHFMKYSFRVIS